MGGSTAASPILLVAAANLGVDLSGVVNSRPGCMSWVGGGALSIRPSIASRPRLVRPAARSAGGRVGASSTRERRGCAFVQWLPSVVGREPQWFYLKMAVRREPAKRTIARPTTPEPPPHHAAPSTQPSLPLHESAPSALTYRRSANPPTDRDAGRTSRGRGVWKGGSREPPPPTHTPRP